MTAQVTDLPAVVQVPDSAEHRDGWARWLTGRIEPGWRPAEWNPATWFFDGDPANPLTSTGVCRVTSCQVKTDGPRICTVCQKVFRVSGMTREQFIASHDATRQKIPNGAADPCLVNRDGTTCAAPAVCIGLCASHYSSFRYVARKHGRSLQDWLPRAHPYPDQRPECLVIGCAELGVARQLLCQYHHRQYRHSGLWKPPTSTTPHEWAERAVPFLRAGQFSLNTLHPLVRLELLYAMQRRSARGAVIQPGTMRLVVNHVRGRDHLVGVSAAEMAGDHWRTMNEIAIMTREVERWLTEGHQQMVGLDPRAGLVWDLRRLNLHANPDVTQIRRAKGTLDFTVISQDWLRQLTMQYCTTLTSSRKLNHTVRVAKTASMALEAIPGGGHAPAELGLAHLDAITVVFRSWKDDLGSPHSQNYRHAGLHTLFMLLDFGRRAGLMDAVPSVFTPDPRAHRIKTTRRVDDEAGKAIPEPVIAQLDRHLDLLSCPVTYRDWSSEQMNHMFRTLYIVLRDTGRRPREVCSLRVDCLEHAADGALLIWDNHKIGRRGRRLPITAPTAQAIVDWQLVRAGLTTRDARDRYLFPARTLGVPDPFFMPANLTDGIRVWVHERIPELLDDAVNQQGQRQPSTGNASTHMRSAIPTPNGTPTPAYRSTSCVT